jgi:histidyl-tRNA synthetase
MKEIVEKVYGKNPTVQTVLKDPAQFNQVVALAKKLTPPQINSIPVFNSTLQPDRTKEVQGFRFMGQRFTIDANIFQRLIDREVPSRMLPKGLDIAAAFGSDEAYNILKALGEDKYKNYTENMDKLRTYLTSVKTDVWTQNVYWNWMYTLKPLTEDQTKIDQNNALPAFMKNQAWIRKNLNTFLGSWTELKHDTYLCADCKAHYEEFLALTKPALGPALEENLRLVRGLDYYTRTVFEFVSSDLGAQSALAAGGRYDDLVEMLGGPATPGVGFALGLDRVVSVAMKKASLNGAKVAPVIFVMPLMESAAQAAFQVARELRAQGFCVPPIQPKKKMKNQLSSAVDSGANWAILIGEDELKAEQVTLKDLSTREQSTIPAAQLTSHLKSVLASKSI